MTGSIQKKNGMLYLVLNTYVNGKRQQTWISTGLPERGNMRRAKELLDEQLEKWSDVQTDYAKMYFHEYLEVWLPQYEQKVKADTYASAMRNVCRRIIPYFEEHKVKLVELESYHLAEFYDYLASCDRFDGRPGKLSPQTIHRHHETISAALTFAVEHRYVKYNVARGMKLSKGKKFIGKSYNLDELTELKRRVRGNPLEIPVVLTCVYGLRRSEVVGLKWDCVDFDERIISIESVTVESHGKGLIEGGTKTEKSQRSFPMTDEIYELLMSEKDKQLIAAAEYAEYGETYNPEGFVCMLDNGNRITPNFVSSHFKRFLEQEGMRVIRFHDLRHSVASNLIDRGFSIVETQEWMGHSTAMTTLDTYSHVVNRNAKHKMAQAMTTGEKKTEITSVPSATKPKPSSDKVIDISEIRRSSTG